MALTLAKEQRLRRARLIDLFEQHEEVWRQFAATAYAYTRETWPEGANVRPDDVSKPLKATLEVSSLLRNALDARKLTAKYYIDDFADLIVERTWAVISIPGGPHD
jgi:hypothetical protein